MNPWIILGIEPTDCMRTIKKAYAAKLKQYNPEDTPEEFQRLRQAYEMLTQGNPAKSPRFSPESKPAGQRREINFNDQQDTDTGHTPPCDDEDSDNSSQKIAAEYAELILKSVRKGLPGQAVVKMKNIFRQLQNEHLDVSYHLELELLSGLIEINKFSHQLVKPLLDHYGWQQRVSTNAIHDHRQNLINEFFYCYHLYCDQQQVKHLEIQRNKQTHQNFQNKNSRSKESSGFPVWTIFVVIFLAFKVIAFIGSQAHNNKPEISPTFYMPDNSPDNGKSYEELLKMLHEQQKRRDNYPVVYHPPGNNSSPKGISYTDSSEDYEMEIAKRRAIEQLASERNPPFEGNADSNAPDNCYLDAKNGYKLICIDKH